MDRHAQTQPLWEHTCCQTRYWSAARMCDRCGAQAAFVVVGVSTADAMARLHSLDRWPVETTPTQRLQATAPLHDSPVVNPDEQVLAAGRHASERRPSLPHGSTCDGDEDERPPSRPSAHLRPDLERALVFGLWFLSGLVCAFMVIGAVVEFERANFARSFTCGISAAAAPTSVIAFAIKHHRSKAAAPVSLGPLGERIRA
jgi:hypothetical protein